MALSRRSFVGRDRELQELRSGFDDATAGRGALFLLAGPAGIGKTRLADEAARAAEAAGLKPLWGRCWETGGAPAYWPFIQVLRELVRGADGAALLAGLGAGARHLAPLLPEQLAPDIGVEAPDPVQARFRLFEASVALLRAAAERAPLFVVLDDLHTADPSSLALLHFLARNLRGLPALVVGTYRDEEARLSAQVGRALTDIAREGAYLPLAPLGRTDIATLVNGAAGRVANEGLVDAIQSATEGNPLFLSELMRLLAASGELGSSARHGVALPIPDTVREVIERRIARLEPDTRAVLATASVVGRDFGGGVLAAVAALTQVEVGRRLEEAEQAGLVSAAGPSAWRFSHVLVREALYRDLDRARRTELHQRVAAALEASGRGEAVVAEIAHHRLSALPEGDATLAAAAARRAADRAMALLAFEDAALLLERAHQALLAAPGSSDARSVCELELLAGMAWIRAGETERGRAACVAAANEAQRLGAGDLLARAALGYGAELMLAQTDAKLVSLLEQALGLLSPEPSGWRAQVLARLAATLQPARDTQVPMAMAREAIAMARVTGDSAVLRTVLLASGAALADYAPAAERAQLSEELVVLATAAGDRFPLMRAQSRLVFDHLELGSVERASRALDGYEAVAREFRQVRHIWPGRLMRAMLASAQGRFDEAARLFDEGARLAEGDPDPTMPFVLAWCRAGRALESERPEQTLLAEEQFLRLRDSAGLHSDVTLVVALVLAGLRARFAEVPVVAASIGCFSLDDPIIVQTPSANALLVEALVQVNDRRWALAFYDRLLPYSGRVVCHGRAGMACGGPFDQALGMLALLTERFSEAERHLEAGVALSVAMGLRPYVVQGKYWLARLACERRGPGDEARARLLIAEARALGEALGMAATLERLRQLEPGAAVQSVAPGKPAGPLPLAVAPAFSFEQEGEYWTISSAGTICRLKSSRGMQMLAELVANPGREFHVLALSGATENETDRGDAGEALDVEAIAEYRARLEELADTITEAEAWGDVGRAARAREEREAIGRELAQGVGLGGRARRTGGAAERARTNVQRRIRGAIKKIGESIPALGTFLERAVRTGTFCSYEPL